MLSVRRCGAWQTAGGHSHTVSATSLCCAVEPHIAACLKTELKQSFVFNFLPAFHCFPPLLVLIVCCFPMSSTLPLSNVPFFAAVVHFLPPCFSPFCAHSRFSHILFCPPPDSIFFVSLVFFSLLLSVLYLSPFSPLDSLINTPSPSLSFSLPALLSILCFPCSLPLSH